MLQNNVQTVTQLKYSRTVIVKVDSVTSVSNLVVSFSNPIDRWPWLLHYLKYKIVLLPAKTITLAATPKSQYILPATRN